MTDYSRHMRTPQSEAVPGREADMAANRAGGVAFRLDKWAQFERFLVLGSEGGTYYASEREMTRENAGVVVACAREDARRAVGAILRFRRENRAPKMSPLLFALAACAKLAGRDAATAANAAVPEVCGTATHLFEFLGHVKALGGTGAGTRRAVARWYNGQEPARLALQVAKYRSRGGWTHRDALRVAHVVAATPQHNDILAYAAGKGKADGRKAHMRLLRAAHAAAAATKASEVIPLIEEHGLPWECIPSALMKDASVNEALLRGMPMTATIRQLGRMSAAGLLGPNSGTARTVIERVSDGEALRRARVHPIQVLSALCTYGSGHGARGSLSWEVNQAIVDALDGAFYAAFGNVEPTGKRTYIAIDVSGSMTWGDIAGVPGLTPRNASAAMAMVTARAEAPGSYHIAGFSDRMEPIGVTPRDRLDTTVEKIGRMDFGRTDCAMPMIDALERGIEADLFLLVTDNETWCGEVHPCQALREYRKRTGIPAKLVVVGMTSTGFTIADPEDAGTLDVVGFDSAAPQVISDFAKA
jgi:60 kDa SS-A/Ro ribonucleoprotein